MSATDEQQATCTRVGAEFLESRLDEKLGVALETLGQYPINGLRHKPESGTCGWYIWCGEDLSADPEFFKPLHVAHLSERLPAALPYLGLAPGWRFLLAPGHEDVWFDASLLETAP
jgi:hypothetical protein